MRRLLVLALLLVAALAHAGERSYTLNAQSVTDAGVSIVFTDNGTGGTGGRIAAQSVWVKNDDAADEVFCNFRSANIGTTADLRIDFGESFTIYASPNLEEAGYFGMSCIASTGETTVVRVRAVAR